MSLWLMRAGAHGEYEETVLENDIVTIHWNDFPDLSKFNSKEGLMNFYFQSRPNTKRTQAIVDVEQIWSFVQDIHQADSIILPLKTQAMIAIGEIKGEYEYKPIKGNIRHIRLAKWLKKIPRTAFAQDILYLLNTSMAVCRISDDNAEARIKELAQRDEFSYVSDSVETKIDTEQYARDEIAKYISQKFPGAELARLVEAILQAQGYITEKTASLSEGNIDLLAASGNVGFDYPRIYVQIKTSSVPVDVKALKELQDAMSRSKADHGLMISWTGFTEKAMQGARGAFFSIKLWDAAHLLDAAVRHYDRFNGELKANLPLKKVWALATGEE